MTLQTVQALCVWLDVMADPSSRFVAVLHHSRLLQSCFVVLRASKQSIRVCCLSFLVFVPVCHSAVLNLDLTFPPTLFFHFLARAVHNILSFHFDCVQASMCRMYGRSHVNYNAVMFFISCLWVMIFMSVKPFISPVATSWSSMHKYCANHMSRLLCLFTLCCVVFWRKSCLQSSQWCRSLSKIWKRQDKMFWLIESDLVVLVICNAFLSMKEPHNALRVSREFKVFWPLLNESFSYFPATNRIWWEIFSFLRTIIRLESGHSIRSSLSKSRSVYLRSLFTIISD